VVPIPGGRLLRQQVFKSWSHGMTNISIPMENMLKNRWTLAVSVAINISMKFCFVSVNGPREPYLLDEPRIIRISSTYL
jgi:hypothetical protein